MVRRRRLKSYAWALPHNVALLGSLEHLTADEQLGLGLAQQRALIAARRSSEAMAGETYIPMLPNHPADNALIGKARRALFPARGGGWADLSDSGIYYRLRRLKADPPEARTCEGPDCEELLPVSATQRKRFHTDLCRVRWNRAQVPPD